MVGAFHAQNKRQYMRRTALGLCPGCGRRKPVRGKALCRNCHKTKLENYYKNKEHKLELQKRYKKKLRDAAFIAYGGPHCACCGESHGEFLSIDHANGDGAEHRRQIGTATHTLLLWLKRNNYPSGFRVLCMNCNFSYGIRGYCPHEKEAQLEKLGVDESADEDLEKEAADGCPACGAKPVRHGNVLICPRCGSEPFEKKTK